MFSSYFLIRKLSIIEHSVVVIIVARDRTVMLLYARMDATLGAIKCDWGIYIGYIFDLTQSKNILS